MAALNPSGMVPTNDQLRDDRRRRGLCDSCRSIEPNQLFDIKRRMGGMYEKKIPLTVPGKVFNGICLDCKPHLDPDGGKHRKGWAGRKKRASMTEAPSSNNAMSRGGRPPHHEQPIGATLDGRRRYDAGRFDGTDGYPRQSNSSPNIYATGLVREMGSRSLGVPRDGDGDVRRRYASSTPADAENENDSERHLRFLEEAYDERGRSREEKEVRPAEQAPREEEEEEYVQEIEYNIFNEPVLVRKKKSSRRNLNHDINNPPSSPTKGGSYDEQNGGSHHNSPHCQARREEAFEHQESLHFDRAPPFHGDNHGDSPPRNPQPYPPYLQNSARQNSPFEEDRGRPRMGEEEKQESLPSLFRNMTNNDDPPNGDGGDDEDEDEGDVLANLIRQHVEANPGEAAKFVPGGALIPNSELHCPEVHDDISVMTPDTCFRETLVSKMSRQASRRTNLASISERSSGDGSGSAGSRQQRSMVSHRIVEPAVPERVARQAGIPLEEPAAAVAAPGSGGSNNNADMESYLESSAPHLLTLREIVGECTQAGADDAAIDTVTQALIHDNATSMSMDLALFCLTTLWVLARKSDENKRKIIFEESTFDAIIEAMQIYRESSDRARSAEIQNRACCVLWSLSMDPHHRRHVAQGGGCEAILNAVRLDHDNQDLQVVALGALKVLSFDDGGKSTLRQRGTPAVVAGVMRNHIGNPTVQSEGCVILGNLATSESSFVAPVGAREVGAVIDGMLAHPDSLEVQEAACFTLMSLASLASNLELIRRNGSTRVALELACKKHPEDVGEDVFTLLRRLKFDSSPSHPVRSW